MTVRHINPPTPTSPLQGLRHFRADLATPKIAAVAPKTRGFEPWAAGPSIVPQVGEAFLKGLHISMAAPTPATATELIAKISDRERGFAMEGAGMGFTIRAVLQPWDRTAIWRLLSVAGERHTYMIHVGIGWGLARTPRILWPNLRHFDPAVAGLILDGYAFHEVFFNWKKFRTTWSINFPMNRWPGTETVGRGHLNQGIGRALWFTCGGSIALIEELINQRPPEEQPSLWAGVGLASAYAMGRDAIALRELASAAGEFAPWLRQGAAFAIEARQRAGTRTPQTEACAQALLGLSTRQISAIVGAARPVPRACDAGEFNAYDAWRARTSQVLVEPGAGLRAHVEREEASTACVGQPA